MSEHTIQPNFKIPAGYKRRFVLSGNGWRIEVRASQKGIKIIQDVLFEMSPDENSASFDWLHETIDRVRFDVE